LDNRQKVKQCDINENIRFWKWIGEDQLAIVGKTGVYHVDINDQAAPAKIFDQESKFATC